jgi:ParB-like chromosome segregation protein Spo0J
MVARSSKTASASAPLAPPEDPSNAMPRVTAVHTSTLIPYARNARLHSDAQVAQIAASLVEFGFTNPVLADDTGIVAGHGRVLAADLLYGKGERIKLPGGTLLPEGTVPVIDCNGWTDAQRRAYIVADNKLALNATWDEQMLGIELAELKDAGFDLGLTGFTSDEWDALIAGGETTSEGDTDDDEVPAPPANHVSRPGDVWMLGVRWRCEACSKTYDYAAGKALNGVCPCDVKEAQHG